MLRHTTRASRRSLTNLTARRTALRGGRCRPALRNRGPSRSRSESARDSPSHASLVCSTTRGTTSSSPATAMPGLEIRGYVDGVSAMSYSDAATELGNNIWPLRFGAWWGGVSGPVRRQFQGELDEIRLYNGVLSSCEVAALANPAGIPDCNGNGVPDTCELSPPCVTEPSGFAGGDGSPGESVPGLPPCAPGQRAQSSFGPFRANREYRPQRLRSGPDRLAEHTLSRRLQRLRLHDRQSTDRTDGGQRCRALRLFGRGVIGERLAPDKRVHGREWRERLLGGVLLRCGRGCGG